MQRLELGNIGVAILAVVVGAVGCTHRIHDDDSFGPSAEALGAPDGGMPDGGDGGFVALDVDRSIPADDVAALPPSAFRTVGGTRRTEVAAFLAEAALLTEADVYLTMSPRYVPGQPAVLRVDWDDDDAWRVFSQDGIYSEANTLTVTGVVVQVHESADRDDIDQTETGSVVSADDVSVGFLRRLRRRRVEGMCGIITTAYNVDNRLRRRRMDTSPRDGDYDEAKLRDIWSDTGDPDAPNGTKRGLLRSEIVAGHRGSGATHAGSTHVFQRGADRSCLQISSMCDEVRRELARGRAGSLTISARMRRRGGLFRRWHRFGHAEPATSARYVSGDGMYDPCECQITTADTLEQDTPFGSFLGVRRTRGSNVLVVRREAGRTEGRFVGGSIFAELRSVTVDYFR